MDNCCKLCLTKDHERFKISSPKGIALNVEKIILKHFFTEVIFVAEIKLLFN